MKKMNLVTGVIIASFVICASISFTQVTADSKKQITADYLSMADAYSKKDIDGVTKYFTADYKDINAGKVKNLETWKKETILGIKSLKSMKLTFINFSFKAVGKDIVVNAKMTLDGQTILGPDKKTHTFKEIEVAKDTWTLVKGDWKCKSSETVSQKTTVDGVPSTP